MSSTVSQEERQLNKGKEKEHRVQQTAHSSILKTSESEALDAISSYPPINDDAEETRRVEENLRRWEIAERRKAARESSQKPALPASRASLLMHRHSTTQLLL